MVLSSKQSRCGTVVLTTLIFLKILAFPQSSEVGDNVMIWDIQRSFKT